MERPRGRFANGNKLGIGARGQIRRDWTIELVSQLNEPDPHNPNQTMQGVVGKLIALALEGSLAAIKEIADRLEGRVAPRREDQNPIEYRSYDEIRAEMLGRVRSRGRFTNGNKFGIGARGQIRQDFTIELISQLSEPDPHNPNQTKFQQVVGKLIALALEGDLAAIIEIADRIEGKVAPRRVAPREDQRPIEYRSQDEIHAAMLERGIDLDQWNDLVEAHRKY